LRFTRNPRIADGFLHRHRSQFWGKSSVHDESVRRILATAGRWVTAPKKPDEVVIEFFMPRRVQVA
jgi:hypothetical protein